MNLEPDTLVDEVEPFLLRAGVVIRTPRGRKVTAAGYEHLGLTPPADSEAIAAAIPGAKLATIEQSGHMSNLENPDAFNAAVLELLLDL